MESRGRGHGWSLEDGIWVESRGREHGWSLEGGDMGGV